MTATAEFLTGSSPMVDGVRISASRTIHSSNCQELWMRR